MCSSPLIPDTFNCFVCGSTVSHLDNVVKYSCVLIMNGLLGFVKTEKRWISYDDLTRLLYVYGLEYAMFICRELIGDLRALNRKERAHRAKTDNYSSSTTTHKGIKGYMGWHNGLIHWNNMC